ncbi:MAG: hypothetical protein AWM53_01970 [Candidatus Dichloromethanomonas elyunquensis]|nr:MAG: hypothetical protein AWM53_01970 [Candidatus Dichloromethanomonas elyunquensis]
MSNGLTVSKILPGSIASEMEIEPGDILLQADGKTIQDVLDLQYYTSEDEFTLIIQKPNHEIWELEIIKEPGEMLGIEVHNISAEGLKKCKNNCVFCFVRQMPPGMRESLYDRDDDYRLSIMQGSYITLSNLHSEEFDRMIDWHLSPLYISVHAWEAGIREKLMRSRSAGKLADQIKMLAEAGLTLHTQIVLVPGYNDGEVLDETVAKLAAFFPSVQSIGIVPVGLTKHRAGLPGLRTVNPEEARVILQKGAVWQKKYKKQTGKNLVYFSDEFYAMTGSPFPGIEDYDDFPQLENGIGMAAKLHAEICQYAGRLPKNISPRRVHIVTGTSAAGFFGSWAKELAVVEGLQVFVHKVANHFFGTTVTVAGLLTAQDIADQLGNLQGDYFLIPRVMLKADEDIFLDDHGIEWVENKANGKAILVANNGRAFLEGLLGTHLEVLDIE